MKSADPHPPRSYAEATHLATQPLLARDRDTQMLFNYGVRQWTDVKWLVMYLVLFLGSLAGGAYAVAHRNPNFMELIAPAHLNDPASCPAPSDRKLLDELDGPGGEGQWRFDALLAHGALWLSVTVGGSLLVAAGFLVLLRLSSRALVGTAICLQIFLPAMGASAAFAHGSMGGGVSLLVLTGLLGLLFFLWREQVELVTRLLGVAGEAMMKNLGLIGVALGLQFGLLLMAAPLAVGMAMSITNGHVGYNYARAEAPSGSGANAGHGAPPCVDEDGNAVMCCTWQVDSWVLFYMTFAFLSLLWTVFLAFEVKVFTVSGTVAQWYFGPVSPARSDTPQGGSRALRSLRHALGPSLGSLCLGSAILTLMSLLRQALQKVREESGNNIFMYICASLLSFFYAIIEFLTKFATVRMAMTGERLFDAGRSVVNLLSRNAMNTVGVWWLPPLILQNCAFVAAITWGFLMWGLGGLQFGNVESGPDSALALGVAAFACGWAVLSFFCALLLNVVDAVFVCFALDRDMNTCTIVEVHEVVSKLPSVGPVFEQPDGNIAYGSPQWV